MSSFVQEVNLYTLLLFTRSQTAMYRISLHCSPVSDVSASHHLRSVNRRLLLDPLCRLSTLGPRAFSVADPSLTTLYTRQLERSGPWQRQLQTYAEDAFSHTVLEHLAY